MTVVQVLRMSELTSALTARWVEVQRSSALYASPFFHPAFARLVAQAREDVHVAVIERDGDAVGFFPFQRKRFGVGRPAGWTLCDYQGVVVEPDVSWSVRELMRACKLHWLEFDHLLADQEQFAPFHRARGSSPAIDLSDGFEAYEHRQRHAGVRAIDRLRKRWARLEREYGPVSFEPHVSDPGALDALLMWKSAQYRRTGMTDLLARPWFRHVIEGAHTASSDGFAGLLSALYAGGRPVALHLGLRSDSVWHYWLPAHDDDSMLSRCSPGLLLILAMAQHAEALGVRALDFGKGETRHKREFADTKVALAEGWVGARTLAAASQLRRRALSMARQSTLGPRARRLANRALRRS